MSIGASPRESKEPRVAQMYQRADGKWTFRVRKRKGHGYEYARDLVGNDDGFGNEGAAKLAARLLKITAHVQIDPP